MFGSYVELGKKNGYDSFLSCFPYMGGGGEVHNVPILCRSKGIEGVM